MIQHNLNLVARRGRRNAHAVLHDGQNFALVR
jgi:hypothetical protein